jgi:hypothetical protein
LVYIPPLSLQVLIAMFSYDKLHYLVAFLA